MNRNFTKEDIQMAGEHMKRQLTLLFFREMLIKTPMRYQYTPIKMTKIKKTDNAKC